jgi:hypothetical protein
MTDPSGLTPEQEAVRRLLADARHDGSTPPEVVARLDDTLASLVSERADNATTAPVVDLGARRRRAAGFGLLAAAAVVVAGVAVGQGLPRMQGSDDSGSAAGGDSATSQREFGASEDGSGSADSELAPESLKRSPSAPLRDYPTLSSTDLGLEEDLLDLRSSGTQRPGSTGSADALSSCALPPLGRGRRVVAEVDGQVGLVVFRRPDGATQQVDLYVCGDAQAVRTLTLPAP